MDSVPRGALWFIVIVIIVIIIIPEYHGLILVISYARALLVHITLWSRA